MSTACATQHHTQPPPAASGTRPNPPLHRSSVVVQDDTNSGTRISTRLESRLANDTVNGGNDEANNSICVGFLHASPSNTTTLSGNDYVEVTANGELRSLSKRPGNSSSSLDKQAGLKSACSVEPAPVLEDADQHPQHYDSLLDPQKKKDNSVHHYDNLLGVQENGSGDMNGRRGGGERREGERGERVMRDTASASENESSEFLDFFDNIEKKRGSLVSLMRYLV